MNMEAAKTGTGPTQRFTERVANYVAYRPKYPAAVLEFMRAELNLSSSSLIADVGAGTGILTEMFVRNGNTVFAVEPNEAMRAAAENSLGAFPNFKSVNGTAEATTLKERSVDFITAAQAFHWFDASGARREFARILKPGGWVALIWNMRRVDTTAFLRELERILRAYGTDYADGVAEFPRPEAVEKIFARGFGTKVFKNEQVFDYEGLRGRMLSSSYVPLAGHPNHVPMFDALRRAFDEYNTNGTVNIEYDTVIYYSQLSEP
jgi:ubiquinone/menaquinone biosynthesis C-methylase UbiE